MKTLWTQLLIGCAGLAACAGEGEVDDPIPEPTEEQTTPEPTEPTEPCDAATAATVQVDAPVQWEGITCAESFHLFRFEVPEAGVYEIEKTGAGTLGVCSDGSKYGCICAVNINCCSDCTLSIDAPYGKPLQPGEAVQIYVDQQGNVGAYSFTITGPN
ncbi:MAG: hypothetical protein KTR31_02395 [Myxococcales bacterium]|nr:hypothetical protein [Myxococcales bacterium]